jgi:hypothetical protein
MAANIITVKQTITTVRIVEALPVDTATDDQIKAFLEGSGYYYTLPEVSARPRLTGILIKTGMARLEVRPSYVLLKVNGQVREPITLDAFNERYNK